MLAPGGQFDWSQLEKRIDHTLLKPTATSADFARLFDEAAGYGFWSVCVPPSRVEAAANRLKGTGVRVCTVIGFPLGYTSTEAKLAETLSAIKDGADEIDMVMNVAAFKSGSYDLVSKEVRDISAVCRASHRLLKVIIECCYLSDDEKVKAARVAEESGADFVKTSTGFGPGGATVEDVVLLRRSLSSKTLIKAAGGISSLPKAVEMIKAGADRIGTSSGVAILEELKRTGQDLQASARV